MWSPVCQFSRSSNRRSGCLRHPGGCLGFPPVAIPARLCSQRAPLRRNRLRACTWSAVTRHRLFPAPRRHPRGNHNFSQRLSRRTAKATFAHPPLLHGALSRGQNEAPAGAPPGPGNPTRAEVRAKYPLPCFSENLNKPAGSPSPNPLLASNPAPGCGCCPAVCAASHPVSTHPTLFSR